MADRFQYHYYGASSLTINDKKIATTRNPTTNTLLNDSSRQPHSMERSSTSSLRNKVNPQTLQELAKLGQWHQQQQQHAPSLWNPRVAVVTRHHPQNEPPQNAPSTTTILTTRTETTTEGNFLIQLGYLLHGDTDGNGGDRTRHGDMCRGTNGAFCNVDPELDETSSQDVSSTISSMLSCPQEFSMSVLDQPCDSAALSGAHECDRKNRTRVRKTALLVVTPRGRGRWRLFVAATVLVLVFTTVLYISWWYGSRLRDGGLFCSKQPQSSTLQCGLVVAGSLWYRVSAQVATKGMTLALRDSPPYRQSLSPSSPYRRTIPFVRGESRPGELLTLTMECYFFVKKSLEHIKVSLWSWNRYLWEVWAKVEYLQGLKQDASSNTSVSTTVGSMSNTTTTTTTKTIAGASDRKRLGSCFDVPGRRWEFVHDDVEFLNDVALQCHMSESTSTAVAVFPDLLPATPTPVEIQSVASLKGLSSSSESIDRCPSNHSHVPRIPATISTGSQRPQTTPILLVGERRHPHFTASNTPLNTFPPLWLRDVDDLITRRIPESFHDGRVLRECEILNLNRIQHLADGRIRQAATEKKLLLIREAIVSAETMSRENDDNHVAKFFRAQKRRIQGFLKQSQIGRR
jgi:hypothetical protein